jgi:hypothetical protein
MITKLLFSLLVITATCIIIGFKVADYFYFKDLTVRARALMEAEKNVNNSRF